MPVDRTLTERAAEAASRAEFELSGLDWESCEPEFQRRFVEATRPLVAAVFPVLAEAIEELRVEVQAGNIVRCRIHNQAIADVLALLTPEEDR